LPAFETVAEAYKLMTGHGVNLLIVLQTQLFSKQLLAAAGSGEYVVYTTILANVGLVLRRRFCHPAGEGRLGFEGRARITRCHNECRWDSADRFSPGTAL
jgi:hypothetical protein